MDTLPLWQFELFLWGISSSFPLANHSHLLASQSVFGISQDPPMCVHASVLAKVDPIDQASR